MSNTSVDPPLSFVFDGSNDKRRDKLLVALQQIVPHIEYQDLGKGIIRIPPELVVMYLSAEDLTGVTSSELLSNRIHPFLEKYPKRIILFEGFHLIKDKKRAILAELTVNLFVSHNLGIIPTRNAEDSMQCLRSLARREQIRDQPPSLGRVKHKPGSLLDSQATLLEGLIQCGPKKQKELMNNFLTPLEVLESIVDSPEKILEIMGFGEKFISQNQKLLTTNFLLKNPHKL
jgi:ERCC4-type nuclease